MEALRLDMALALGPILARQILNDRRAGNLQVRPDMISNEEVVYRTIEESWGLISQ